MKYLSIIMLTTTLILSGGLRREALGRATQAQSSAQEKADGLRAQLSEVETKQADLRTRLQDLNEQLKPENIEKTLAGVGSTRPEDLREQRRRQLEIERNGVQKQLDLLTTSHTRLETAIAQTDAEAYRQSAAPATNAAVGPSTSSSSTTADSTGATTTPVTRPRRAKKKKTRKSKRTTSSAIRLKVPGSQIRTITGPQPLLPGDTPSALLSVARFAG